MPSKQNVYQSTTATENFQPFVLEGKTLGEVHWLRDSGSGAGLLLTGLWRSSPITFEYIFPGDETFHVLEGKVNIKLEGGDQVSLQSGDIASFAKGLRSMWEVTAPFKSFSLLRVERLAGSHTGGARARVIFGPFRGEPPPVYPETPFLERTE